MPRLITTISALIFIITFPILILWQPLSVRVIYSLVNLPADRTHQAAAVINNLYQSGFTNAEISHLDDVYNLVHMAKTLWLLSLIALVLAFLINRKHLQNQFILSLRSAAKLCLILCSCILLFLLFAWNSAFITFHQILFPQGNWAFPADSLIITLFPEIFWQTIFAVYLFLVIILSLSFWIITRRFLVPTVLGTQPVC